MANTIVSSGQLEMEGSLTASIYGCFANTTATGTQIALSQLYRGATSPVVVPNILQNANIPTSGEITYSNFYGATNNTTPTWAVEVTPASGTTLNAICYGATGGYVAVGGNSGGQGVVYYSATGTSWTLVTLTSSSELTGVATNGAGVYVAISSAGNGAYSTNGTSWTTLTATNTSGLNVIAYGDGYFAGGTTSGAVNYALTANITSTWTAGTAFTGGSAVTALAYTTGNSTPSWVAGASGGNLHTSVAGAPNAFTSQTSSITGGIIGFGWNGSTQVIAISNSGTTWYTTSSPPSSFSQGTTPAEGLGVGNLVHNGTAYSGVGADGNIYYSANPNGTAWSVSDTYAGAVNILALASESTTSYVAVGIYILYSSVAL